MPSKETRLNRGLLKLNGDAVPSIELTKVTVRPLITNFVIKGLTVIFVSSMDGTASPFNLSKPLWSALGRGGKGIWTEDEGWPLGFFAYKWFHILMTSMTEITFIFRLDPFIVWQRQQEAWVPRRKGGKLQNNTNPTMPILLWKITNVGKLLVHFDRLAVHNVIYTRDSWQVLTDNHNCDDNHTSLLLWYFSASSFAWRRLLVVSSRIICIFSNSNCLTFISFCRSDCLLSAESCNCRNLQQSKKQHINNASFYSGLSSHQSHVAKAQFKRQSFHVPNGVIARGGF